MTESAPQVAFTSKRIQNMKSKRKQVLVKKAHELARIASLKVVVIVYDDSHQTMQEFCSDEKFGVEAANRFKSEHSSWIIDNSKYANASRRSVPTSKYIEQIRTQDYLKAYKCHREMILNEIEQAAEGQKSLARPNLDRLCEKDPDHNYQKCGFLALDHGAGQLSKKRHQKNEMRKMIDLGLIYDSDGEIRELE